MTWSKKGAEFADQCSEAGLSDAAYRTHDEAIMWLYRLDRGKIGDLSIGYDQVRRFAGSADWEQAVKELVEVGFWRDKGTHYVLIHHADVVRGSLGAQKAKRERDRKAQQSFRHRNKPQASDGDSPEDISTDVSADISDEVIPYPVSQSESVSNAKRDLLSKPATREARKYPPQSVPEVDGWPQVAPVGAGGSEPLGARDVAGVSNRGNLPPDSHAGSHSRATHEGLMRDSRNRDPEKPDAENRDPDGQGARRVGYCSVCNEPMRILEPGQTTHPMCG